MKNQQRKDGDGDGDETLLREAHSPRSTAGRANHFTLDRPDPAFATKSCAEECHRRRKHTPLVVQVSVISSPIGVRVPVAT